MPVARSPLPPTAARVVTTTAALALLALGATPLRAQYPTAVAPAPDLPAVAIGYSFLLDGPCAAQTGRPLDMAFVAAVQGRVPRWTAVWAQRGPVLLRTARDIVGVPFAFHETTAAIATCGLPSMSFPLVLNARSFWRGAADTSASAASVGDSTARQEALFANTLFHELMHRYITERVQRLPGRTTPLLTKYAGESPVVQSHLHLFALEELVYARLGTGAELQLAYAVDRQLFNAAMFERAHAIVAAEGADAFVKELKDGSAAR